MANGRQCEPILQLEPLDQRRKEHRVRKQRQEREILARRDYRNARQQRRDFYLGTSESIAQHGIGATVNKVIVRNTTEYTESNTW